MTDLLIVTSSMRGGGAERRILELMEGLDRKRFRITLFLADRKGELLDQVPQDIRVFAPPRALGFLRKIPGFYSLAILVSIARLIRSERPNTILSRLTTMNILMLWAARLSGRRGEMCLVATESTNTLVAYENSVRRFRTFRNFGVAYAYRSVDMIVCLSESLRSSLCQWLATDPTKVIVIPNGLNIERIDEAIRTPMDMPEVPGGNSVVIAMAGDSLAKLEIKGVHHLVKAISIARLPLSLILLGVNPESEHVQRWASEASVTDRVLCVGFQANPYPWIARADLFVSASLWEGAPTGLLDAFACRTPIVATRCPGGVVDILENGRLGLLVNPGSPEELAEGISDMLGAPDRVSELASLARKVLEESYGFTTMIHRYEELLERLPE